MAELKNVAPLADFDWNAYESGDTQVNESREAQEKAYEGSLNKVNDHEVVDGTVIAMNKREVVVNIGFKSDGIIPMSEFRYNPDTFIWGQDVANREKGGVICADNENSEPWRG